MAVTSEGVGTAGNGAGTERESLTPDIPDAFAAVVESDTGDGFAARAVEAVSCASGFESSGSGKRFARLGTALVARSRTDSEKVCSASVFSSSRNSISLLLAA